jgi:dTDP-glucose 4,6-dehydratase
MKVLVMGGTRFNGLALVHELVRCGHEVTMFNRGASAAEVPASVRRLYGDRHDHDAMQASLGTTSWDCVQDISAYTLEDVQGVTRVLHGRMGHYVFASSTVTYAQSNFPPITEDHPSDRGALQSTYGMNKLLCEDSIFELHRTADLPITIAAFSMVFGPNNIIADREQRMFSRILQDRPVLIPGDGTTLGQVGHVDDQARALCMLMGNPHTFGRKYNLTGNDFYTDEGYVDTCARVLGRSPEKVFVPPNVMDTLHARDPMCSRYLVQRVAPNLRPWNDSALFSIDRLRTDIGWEPRYSFETAVEQTYAWYVDSGMRDTREFDFAPEDALLAELGRV